MVRRSSPDHEDLSVPVDQVAKEALGIDRIEVEALAQLLTQLGDVALDDVLFDVLVEDAVDGIEDLLLGDPAAAVCDQVFQDAALTARQREGATFDFRITTIGIDADRTNIGVVGERLEAATDRCGPSLPKGESTTRRGR